MSSNPITMLDSMYAFQYAPKTTQSALDTLTIKRRRGQHLTKAQKAEQAEAEQTLLHAASEGLAVVRKQKVLTKVPSIPLTRRQTCYVIENKAAVGTKEWGDPVVVVPSVLPWKRTFWKKLTKTSASYRLCAATAARIEKRALRATPHA